MVRTPASLLQRLKQPGDQEAWERFVALYGPMIYRWALQTGLESNAAADLTQDVFVILVRKLPEFPYDRGRSFRAWLKTVTRNRWRETRRRLPGRPDQTIDGDVPDPDSLLAAGPFEEETEYRRELTRRAMSLIRHDFEPTTWDVWWDYVMTDRPAAEVADRFGVTVNSVYLTKSRVLRRLREELDGLLD